MASIGSREVQEDIVGPLMDMMGRLSTEMRKNLSVEVSSINRRLDEVNKKVDYLISRLVENELVENDHRTKGNDKFVSEKHVVSEQSVNINDEEADSPWFSSSYDVAPGKPPTELDIIPLSGREFTGKLPEQQLEDVYSIESTELDEHCMYNEPEVKGGLGLENRECSPLKDAASSNQFTQVSDTSDENVPKPYSEMNGHTNEIDIEEGTSDDESETKTKIVSMSVSKPNTSGNFVQTQAKEESEMPPLEGKSDKIFKSNPSPMNTVAPQQSLGQRDRRRRQGLFNFGNTNVHKRPQSPPPKNETKDNVSYIHFKKSRTEFTEDNRTEFLKDALNISETDQHTPDKASAEPTPPVIDMAKDQSKNSDNLSMEIENTAGAGNTIPAQSQSSGSLSNNQQLAKSGFKNEHGDVDNRFAAAAHAETRHPSVMHRTSDLSNCKLIKTGPRRQADDTEQEDQDTGKMVPDDVLYSLIEKERLSAGECTDMKSPGIDTVICLDTSASMAGRPLAVAIAAIEKIVNGFETNAIYHDLEENIALVTFGNENTIRCHLTNDYGIMRKRLENIQAGGPSPLWLGIALSLAEIKERGGACVMKPMTVLPRIILITDGFASRKNLLDGDDNAAVDDQVIREILSLLGTCTSFTSSMECIKPGKCHEEILKTITDGKMYTPEDLEYMTEFFSVQEKANDIIKRVTNGELDLGKVDETIQSSQLSDTGKDTLKQLLPKDLLSVDQQNLSEGVHENEVQETVHSNTSEEDKPIEDVTSSQKDTLTESMPITSLDIIDDVKAPAFGTKVLPNSEWIGFATRQHFTGTVIGARKRGLVKILWSDGSAEKCKFGVNGQYHFTVAEDQDVDSSHLHIGSMVTRGRDWRWKDQDGGEGNVGVVMKLEGPVVHVIWPHGGLGNYRYGYNKKFDLALCKTRRIISEEKHYVWYIEEEDNHWQHVPPEVNESIEQMFKAEHTGTFLVKMGEKSLRISIQHFQARDPSTQTAYSIERRELSREEWLAINHEQ